MFQQTEHLRHMTTDFKLLSIRVSNVVFPQDTTEKTPDTVHFRLQCENMEYQLTWSNALGKNNDSCAIQTLKALPTSTVKLQAYQNDQPTQESLLGEVEASLSELEVNWEETKELMKEIRYNLKFAEVVLEVTTQVQPSEANTPPTMQSTRGSPKNETQTEDNKHQYLIKVQTKAPKAQNTFSPLQGLQTLSHGGAFIKGEGDIQLDIDEERKPDQKPKAEPKKTSSLAQVFVYFSKLINPSLSYWLQSSLVFFQV